MMGEGEETEMKNYGKKVRGGGAVVTLFCNSILQFYSRRKFNFPGCGNSCRVTITTNF